MNTEFLDLLKPPKKGIKIDRRKIEEMNQIRLYCRYMHGNVTRKLPV
jgi:hypothetical protein